MNLDLPWDLDHVPLMAEQLTNLAWVVGWRDESAYWYCEALAVACACSVICGIPSDSLLHAVHEAYEEIQRLDRWEHLKRALDAIPKGRYEFAREFVYMFTW